MRSPYDNLALVRCHHQDPRALPLDDPAHQPPPHPGWPSARPKSTGGRCSVANAYSRCRIPEENVPPNPRRAARPLQQAANRPRRGATAHPRESADSPRRQLIVKHQIRRHHLIGPAARRPNNALAHACPPCRGWRAPVRTRCAPASTSGTVGAGDRQRWPADSAKLTPRKMPRRP